MLKACRGHEEGSADRLAVVSRCTIEHSRMGVSRQQLTSSILQYARFGKKQAKKESTLDYILKFPAYVPWIGYLCCLPHPAPVCAQIELRARQLALSRDRGRHAWLMRSPGLRSGKGVTAV